MTDHRCHCLICSARRDPDAFNAGVVIGLLLAYILAIAGAILFGGTL